MSLDTADGRITCYGTDGQPLADVDIKCKLLRGPGGVNSALVGTIFTLTSDDEGVAYHAGFIRGATYQFWIDGSTNYLIQDVPETGTGTAAFDIVEIIG